LIASVTSMYLSSFLIISLQAIVRTGKHAGFVWFWLFYYAFPLTPSRIGLYI
jgi:hypothetical protein